MRTETKQRQRQKQTIQMLDSQQNKFSLGPSLSNLPTNSLLNPNPNLPELCHDGCCVQDPSSEEEVLSWNDNVEDIPESEPEEE